jgi:hypothetical protein
MLKEGRFEIAHGGWQTAARCKESDLQAITERVDGQEMPRLAGNVFEFCRSFTIN